MSNDTEQETLVDAPQKQVELDARTLETVAKTLAPITDTATLHVTNSTIQACASDLANAIAVDTGTHTADATTPFDLTVDTEALRDASGDGFGPVDRTHLTVVDDETAAVVDEHYYAEVERFPGDMVLEPTVFEKIDSGRIRFDAAQTFEAWDVLGMLETVARPSDIDVRVSLSDDGLAFEGSEADFSGEGITTTYPYRKALEPTSIDKSAARSTLAAEGYIREAIAALPARGTVTVAINVSRLLYLTSSDRPRILIAPRNEADGGDDQ